MYSAFAPASSSLSMFTGMMVPIAALLLGSLLATL
jgi:hypothetical protein